MAIFIRDARFDVDKKGKKISGSIQSSVFVSKDSFLFFNLDEDSSISRILKVSTRTIRIKVEREWMKYIKYSFSLERFRFRTKPRIET